MTLKDNNEVYKNVKNTIIYAIIVYDINFILGGRYGFRNFKKQI